jgi:hypothetical protein
MITPFRHPGRQQKTVTGNKTQYFRRRRFKNTTRRSLFRYARKGMKASVARRNVVRFRGGSCAGFGSPSTATQKSDNTHCQTSFAFLDSKAI